MPFVRATPLPADERRQAIIAATRPLLIASGGQFTSKQVAEAAGIAEGTIFRVFDSMQDLLCAVIEDTLDPTELCQQIAALTPQPSLSAHLARLIELLQHNTDEITAVATALHRASPGTTGRDHRGHHTGLHHQRSTVVRAAVAESLTPWADHVRLPLPQLASLVRSVALAASHPMLTDHELTDPGQLAEVLVHGIAKD